MAPRPRLRWVEVIVVIASPLLAMVTPAVAQETHPGKAPYDRWCAGCHGVEGDGNGSSAPYMLPRPRDFTTGQYQIRSTPSGALPTDEDILRVIDEGIPGTTMPGWSDLLGGEERRHLVDYLKTFSAFFERLDPPEPVTISSPPDVSEEGLAEGREIYEKIECFKCHGRAGRGDGQSAPTLEDDQGFPIRARDLTRNWLFDGGGSVEEIYKRLLTGLNGTPMPANADLIDAGVVTEEQLWRVAQYVRSLSQEDPPGVREVIRAVRTTDLLPETADDDAWDRVDSVYVPLVGQIIVKPRWFAPTVDGVWVQALHDGQELALRVEWNDPSRSPDPDWDEWRTRLEAVMFTDVGDEEIEALAGPGPTAASEEEGGEEVLDPDAFAVQFPRSIPEGMERPYFLMGDSSDPVYLWHWESGSSGPGEKTAHGLAEFETLGGAGEALQYDESFEDGRWRLLMRRPLAAGDVPDRLEFETGKAIPMAFFVWDGSSGESGSRGSISTWYFLYLDEPASRSVYVAPLLATLLTALLGVVVVTRAQRRTHEEETTDRSHVGHAPYDDPSEEEEK